MSCILLSNTVDYFSFVPLYFRSGFVAIGNGQHRYFCGQKEPFAFLLSESYALVGLDGYYDYQMTLKAFYAVMTNGKLTVRLIK